MGLYVNWKNIYPEAAFIVAGDLNKANLKEKGNRTLLLIVSLIFNKFTYCPHGLRQSFDEQCAVSFFLHLVQLLQCTCKKDCSDVRVPFEFWTKLICKQGSLNFISISNVPLELAEFWIIATLTPETHIKPSPALLSAYLTTTPFCCSQPIDRN